MRVICYRNLNRGDWSFAAIKGRSGVGKLIAHMPELTLANVTFVVRESARQRVVRKQCREVHAWAVGELAEHCPADLPRIAIAYNPYRAPTFVRRNSGEPITRSDFVRFTRADGAIDVGTIG